MRIRAAVIACIALLATLLSTPARANPAEATPPAGTPRADKIQPALRDQLTRKSVAPVAFWVRFGTQPDLSKAAAIDDWKARGTAVAEALQRAAQSSQHDIRAQLDAAGTSYQAFWATNAIRVTGGSLAMAEQLAASVDVEGLYATTSYQPPKLDKKTAAAKEAAAVEWGIANINADDVWNQYGDRGAGITVASIDSGVQYDHPALVQQYRGTKPDGTFDHNYNWFDAAGTCGPVPCDHDGHGTHTMGTMIGADGIGVAPEANWIAANGCCPSDASLIASGQWMLQPTDLAGQNPDAGRRPQIINNSWGSETPSNDPFMEDITKAWAASGIFAVWSNGNNGLSCHTSGSPGSLASNYSTGAYDVNNTIADFSSRGGGQDGVTKPNLSAPGVDVRSSVPGGYAYASGTSMAAPHVAGSVALLWSAAPGLVGDVDATRALLDGSSADTPDGQCGGTDADNNVYGEGRLNALALVDSAPVGDTGTLAIAVTDSRTGKAIPSAGLKISGPVSRERTAGDDGKYSLPLPVGTYSVAASSFGYDGGTAQVTVTAAKTTQVAVRLRSLPRVTVSGTVEDGSGQGWPLYAKLTVDDVPGGVFYTKPENGRYSFELPANASYSYKVEAVYPGYRAGSVAIDVRGKDVRRDVSLTVDPDSCVAPGYSYAGVSTDFDDGQPAGWTNNGWRFDDPYRTRNRTGGNGGFAIGQTPGNPVVLDASLVSPALDLRGRKSPVITFRQNLQSLSENSDVDLSLDGGTTWQTVLDQPDDVQPERTVVPIPQAAGKDGVRVRFHYWDAKYNTYFWQVDDVFVGDLTCGPVNGGLVLGQVSDRNTGAVLNGASVQLADRTVRTAATPADGGVGDGFYWMFSPAGRQTVGTSFVDYQDSSERVQVQSRRISRVDLRLSAGELSVKPGAVTMDVKAGGVATARFTVQNTGTAAANVSFGERQVVAAGNSALVAGSNSVARVAGDYSPLALSRDALDGNGHGSGAPAAGPWVDLTHYPTRIMDNTVGEVGGLVYSVGGVDGRLTTAKGYVYNPSTQEWSPIADLPDGRENAAGAFIGDTFYVSGGWGPDLVPSKGTFGYDRRTDTWTRLADAPDAQAAAGRTVLDGKLYLVGGCSNACDSRNVRRYDPATNTWDVLADYPEPGGHRACGVLEGKVYCAGGIRRGGAISQSTFAYDPATNVWTKKADLPIDLWGMGYTESYGRLLVSGGITTVVSGGGTTGAITNEGFSYDPATDRWSALAPSRHVLYRGGSACGLNRIGGSAKSGFIPVDSAEQLPTYGACGETDVPWMSVTGSPTTLAPGRSVTVTVRVNAAGLKAGAYSAGVWIGENTPYLAKPVDVTLRVR
ncbi:S8 family serine peptidase [Kribbella sp. NPDC050281]|uniref:S8 family serine peptidase n=1 Tax=Kribbella sp. NPDC050281 TaxID=3155515 RepID=UPI0033F83068